MSRAQLHDGRAGPLPPQFYVRAISDRWSACSHLLELSTGTRVCAPQLRAHGAPIRRVLEALQDDRFQQFYGYSHFNPVQTQVFHALFRTDGNRRKASTGAEKPV